MATATFILVCDALADKPGENKGPLAQPLQSCFVFVPPSDAPNFNQYLPMRRWLDQHREQRNAKLHRFRLDAGAILPASAVFRVGDSLDQWLNSEFPLSLEMFSNPPIGPGPDTIRHYTFKKTELLPIRISAISQTDATSHALVLDHEFGAASGKNGKVVISGLPVGIDIPMRISLPAASGQINFRSDTLAIMRNGQFTIKLEGDTQFRITISQGRESPESTHVESSSLPDCVRVSGAMRDANQLLLQPTTLSFGLGPCSEACEITVNEALDILKKYPTVKELQLCGWPVATNQCQELMLGIAGMTHITQLTLLDLQIDKPTLALAARNPHLRELALGGRCRFSEAGEEDFAWVFDSIAQLENLERLEISRHTELQCHEVARLERMLRLRHFAFDGPVDAHCLEGIASIRSLSALELPEYDLSVSGIKYLAGLKNLQHLTCTWTDPRKPSELNDLLELQSLTIVADPRFINWEAIRSLPKVLSIHVQNRKPGTIENALGMKFLPIPLTLPGRRAEKIYIQQAEVTFEQYRKFKVAAGLTTTRAELIPSDQPLAPQDFDCWDDAARFIAQLNLWDKTYNYRMPTEDEWEFACNGRLSEPRVSRTICEDLGNTNRWTLQSEPNQFGLHDMLGVYGEYCSDLYNRNDDPSLRVIAEGKDARVVRGMRQNADKPGCYRYSRDYRFPVAPAGGQTAHLTIGVRLVLEPKK
ncbi:MAG: SUMF1/EgtB/PvdO family nonheme iron enzyme [Pirellulaceae bacterium]